jgi:hypothetical protein
MDMPKIGEAQRQLERLVGSWEGKETLHPSPWDPAGGTAVGRVVNRLALDGFAVIQEYEQERNGKVNFRGHGIFRWDDASRSYVLYWFDSFGMPPGAFHGGFKDGVLTLTDKGSQGQHRAVFDLSDPGKYRFRMEVSPDGGQWQPVMEGSYTKRG